MEPIAPAQVPNTVRMILQGLAAVCVGLFILTVGVIMLKWHESDMRCRAYVAETQLQNYTHADASFPGNACGLGS